MEFFNKNKTMIFRVAGLVMILIAFVMFFWTTPKEGLTQNERAAANVARMEAKVQGGSSRSSKPEKQSHSPIMKAYKDTQAEQMRYALILMMIIGIGSFGYSFIKKEDVQS